MHLILLYIILKNFQNIFLEFMVFSVKYEKVKDRPKNWKVFKSFDHLFETYSNQTFISINMFRKILLKGILRDKQTLCCRHKQFLCVVVGWISKHYDNWMRINRKYRGIRWQNIFIFIKTNITRSHINNKYILYFTTFF